MIVIFADQGTEDIFDGKDTKASRRALPLAIQKIARRKLV
jgi:toxin HigB-1